ncbi:MAG TPA: hypothetical protein VGB55_02065 [Tepidisphaeraceae bacterium]
MMRKSAGAVAAVCLLLGGCAAPKQAGSAPISAAPASPPQVTASRVQRVSTAVPFPRGLRIIDDKLYALARGRVREAGGADSKVEDQAGSLFVLDPNIGEPLGGEVSDAVRHNGVLFAAPTSPPFKLFDRTKIPATADRETDRPYCGLAYDPISKNFFVCAFSGIDKPEQNGSVFSKNLSDALFRYDTRSAQWHVVERHDIEKGGLYPHSDPAASPPPHGWLNGPDNCLVVGHWLYAVAKENNLLVRYPLMDIARNPAAGPPMGERVLDDKILVRGQGLQSFQGHSMLAAHDGYLYVGYRTSSVIVRFPIDAAGNPKQPIEAELVARFDAYNPATRKSANLTDMAIGPEGDVYVISAQPSRVYRFTPSATRVYDARAGRAAPWADLAELTKNSYMKSENLTVARDGTVYVTSGDAYDFQSAGGTIYAIKPDDEIRNPNQAQMTNDEKQLGTERLPANGCFSSFRISSFVIR